MKRCPKRKGCEERVTEFIESAAHIENALAQAISAESQLINEGELDFDEALLVIEKLEKLIKLAIKKEIILEFLLEDIVESCNKHSKCYKNKSLYDY